MSKLQFQLELGVYDWDPQPLVPAEIIDDQLKVAWKGSIPIGSLFEREVEPGLYAVRVKLPSGDVIQEKCEIAAGETQIVRLETAEKSPHEWLQWINVLKGARSAGITQVLKRSMQLYELVEVGGGREGKGRVPALWDAWMKVHSRTPQGWDVDKVDLGSYHKDGGAVSVNTIFPDGMHWLQFGSSDSRWQFMALPCLRAGGSLLIYPEIGSDYEDTRIRVYAGLSHGYADMILKYMTDSAMTETFQLNSSLTLQAEELLYYKIQNPAAAAVGGYALLRIGALEKLRSWAHNLADWFEWMPDGCVIDAWQLLRMEKPNYDLAAKRLLQAADRGAPVFTEGLRLLHDGLRLLLSDEYSDKRTVRTAFDKISSYAKAADWRSPFTCVTGGVIDKPSLKYEVGVPSDRTGLYYLNFYDLDSFEFGQDGGRVLSTNR